MNQFPQQGYAWSLGTTILQPASGKRCVCAFDANGEIYHPEHADVEPNDDFPPGTPIVRTAAGRWELTAVDEHNNQGSWLSVARKHAVSWRVDRTICSEHWGQWTSSNLFPCALEWYPTGSYSPTEQSPFFPLRPDLPRSSPLPRSPGCWECQFELIPQNLRTRIALLDFRLEREPCKEGWLYRAHKDEKFGADWTVKFDGRPYGEPPPEVLPRGTLVAVFLAIGQHKYRWHPQATDVGGYVFLKIGSVLSRPDPVWTIVKRPAR